MKAKHKNLKIMGALLSLSLSLSLSALFVFIIHTYTNTQHLKNLRKRGLVV
jgi:hypothetical protein